MRHISKIEPIAAFFPPKEASRPRPAGPGAGGLRGGRRDGGRVARNPFYAADASKSVDSVSPPSPSSAPHASTGERATRRSPDPRPGEILRVAQRLREAVR